MEKCTRYLDALDKNAADDSSEWQDVLIHAGKCPDCATAMNVRAEMLELLAGQPEPEYPDILHESIVAAVNASKNHRHDGSEPGFFGRIFEQFLPSLEIAVSVACLLMFVVLIQLEKDHITDVTKAKPFRVATKTATGVIAKAPELDKESLEHVSSEEVKEFLDRLKEFRRIHPDKPSQGADFSPEVQLVNDNNFWRQP
ncbi:MAG: hypothetical protein EOM80_00115 [Erysipelotrichia bacterium]|nr:hypothetical protein [Candidatus Riflebacteria bacterium]NCB37145.1 hypothetical protein [Erysipelotrichia bacterium]